MDECFVCFLDIVDISMVAVSFFGKNLHLTVFIIPHTITQNG